MAHLQSSVDDPLGKRFGEAASRSVPSSAYTGAFDINVHDLALSAPVLFIHGS